MKNLRLTTFHPPAPDKLLSALPLFPDLTVYPLSAR